MKRKLKARLILNIVNQLLLVISGKQQQIKFIYFEFIFKSCIGISSKNNKTHYK